MVQELLSAPTSHFLADNDSFASSLIKSFHKEAFVLKLKYEPAREPWLGVRRSHVPHFTPIYLKPTLANILDQVVRKKPLEVFPWCWKLNIELQTLFCSVVVGDCGERK